MARVLSLWFPTLSTDRITRRHTHAQRDHAVLITRPQHGREVVHAACTRGAAAGVRAGQDLAQARSLLPLGLTPVCLPHRPDQDHAALQALARWMLRLTPTVTTEPPDGVACDLAGTTRLWRSELRAARSAVRALTRLGFSVRAAVAGSRLCAWAVSRYGASSVARVSPGDEARAVGPLPIEALGETPACVLSLQQAGVTRIEHLLRLPRAAIAARYGLPLLQRLDRITARDTACAPERIDPIRPTSPAQASIHFDGPTDQWESVHTAAIEALGTLLDQLHNRQRGVLELQLALRRPSGVPDLHTLRLTRPSLNHRHLRSMLTGVLERVDLAAGIEGVDLTALHTARVPHHQQTDHALTGARGGTGPDAQSLAELTDTLLQRLGPEAVRHPAPRHTHLPEDGLFNEPVGAAARQPPDHHHDAPRPRPADRPTHLFPRPLAVEVTALTPDGPVMQIAWQGRHHQVAACIGPERIGPRWWRWDAPDAGPHHARTPPPDRDYFALQIDDGRWLWACRQVGTGRWFIHGQWT